MYFVVHKILYAESASLCTCLYIVKCKCFRTSHLWKPILWKWRP